MAGEQVWYVDDDGNRRDVRNQLTEAKERELREHLASCPKPFKRCPDCWLAYKNIGHEECERILYGQAS